MVPLPLFSAARMSPSAHFLGAGSRIVGRRVRSGAWLHVQTGFRAGDTRKERRGKKRDLLCARRVVPSRESRLMLLIDYFSGGTVSGAVSDLLSLSNAHKNEQSVFIKCVTFSRNNARSVMFQRKYSR